MVSKTLHLFKCCCQFFQRLGVVALRGGNLVQGTGGCIGGFGGVADGADPRQDAIPAGGL